MTKIKLVLSFVFSTLLLTGIFLARPSATLAAPRLYFEPAATTVKKDSEFEIKLQIDVESQSAFGADAIVNFPATDLNLVSVGSGGFFTDFAYATSTGQIEIHGYFSALFDTKSGSGTFATLKFSAKKDNGASALTFTCSNNDTQILNTSGNNILSCSSLNQTNLTYSGTSSGDTSGNQATEPNSCGGTCGSNYNCKADLYCYQGFCRNPACRTDTDCVCPTTTTGTKTKTTPTPKPKVVVAPTPQIIILHTPTPKPPEQTPPPETPAAEVAITKGRSLLASLLIIGGALVVGVIAYFTWRWWKKSKNNL